MMKKISDGVVQIDSSVIVLENVTTVTKKIDGRGGEPYERKLFVNGVCVGYSYNESRFNEVKKSLVKELKA